MLLMQLKEAIEQDFIAALAEEVKLCQDAILVHLVNGVDLEIRYQSGEQYSMGWRWGDAALRIDTAPLHPELETFPHHFHDAADQLRPDPVTYPGAAAWDNVRSLLERLLIDPLLGSVPAR